MPYVEKFIEPELFLAYAGVKIYCTYKDDLDTNGPSKYYFSTDPTNEYSGGERKIVDVRELDVESKKDFANHPPYLSESDPIYAAASVEQRLQWKQQWEQWHAIDEPEIVKRILREAIDKGLIKAE